MALSLLTFAAAATVSFRSPLPLYSNQSPFKTHQSSFLPVTSPAAFTKPSTSQSTQSSPLFRRKLLCAPVAAGKYVREDSLIKKLTADEVEELVKGVRKVPLIIDFYSTWCGPCNLMAQELEMLAIENENNALIVKVDTDEEHEFARDMQVRGLPTLYFISPDPNKEAIRTEGLIPLQMIREIINNHM
ncbi:thioredoxin-like protein CITRX2, chloroplastic [Impatiens glandulifera]|uniref:thioredoxin-like protein CITRX2, chloroplastic n=1 Tax=Impatiens glandulifera TaxID=253017 RepID=UPI001FB07756|nr:thioredoxin-like protein CITRX2, chloroplastic [Impatiens glandulifera]